VDRQLVRFGLCILVIMLAIAVLVEGASRVGLPAYSLVARLGIRRIAVALAARESLSSLQSSLIIRFEKPFRMGHWIRTSETEGTVESDTWPREGTEA
jgi:MscS family membrane protein